jgi:4-amino-4-deoxy-L-arabinose transferase-like glycosyltransferase
VGLAGQALTVGGFAAAFTAFVVAALALVVLMFALALAIALARERAVHSVQARGPAVKRWGGRILVVVGVWFVLLGVFADVFAELFPV